MMDVTLKLLVEGLSEGKEHRITGLRLAAFLTDKLIEAGMLRDTDEAENAPAKRDPLVSEICWSTDFSKPPTITHWTNMLFMVWSSEFRMECVMKTGSEVLHVFTGRTKQANQGKDDVPREQVRPKEFAWAEVVDWPAAAHEAIAERLQVEADRFARQAKEARDKAA